MYNSPLLGVTKQRGRCMLHSVHSKTDIKKTAEQAQSENTCADVYWWAGSLFRYCSKGFFQTLVLQ